MPGRGPLSRLSHITTTLEEEYWMRELFLTMFYTINSSSLLVTKYNVRFYAQVRTLVFDNKYQSRPMPLLKTLDTFGNCQRPVFSHLVYLNICTKYQTCENLNSIACRSCEIIMEEKTPLSHEVVCFQMLDFETSNSKSEVSKSNSWKITSFLKTMALQREPFLTMFYIINLSPLLVTKWGFMLIIILSNYQ